MTTPCPESVSLGAYLLGALDPEERRAMERHVAGCEQCRAELVELAPLPGLLRHTPFEELPETAAAAESLSPVREQPALEPVPAPPVPAPQHRRQPRRRTALLAAAGMVLAASVAGLGVYAAVGRGSTPPAAGTTASAAAVWSATDSATRVSARASVFPEAWGTQFQLTLSGLPSGVTCHMVVHGKGGLTETAGTWGSGYAASALVPASTSISPAEITGLDIVDGSGKTLVKVPVS